jgi:hypothetical protein
MVEWMYIACKGLKIDKRRARFATFERCLNNMEKNGFSRTTSASF